MTKWTDRQLQAITARNREILVSAAAGSGKTAVLIQRVMSLLEAGLRLDRMLVVTFTHAAADEMKERLTGLLSEAAGDSAHLRAQFSLLGRADISTLHSFCMRLLKAHFQAADTDPLAQMADEALARELFEQALDQALDDYHEAPSQEGQALFDRFSEEQVIQMVTALHHFLMSKDAPEEWLDAALGAPEAPGSLYERPWYTVMAGEARLLLQGASDTLEEALALCLRPDGPARYTEAIQDDLAMVAQLRKALAGQPRFTWTRPTFTRLPSKKAPPQEDPQLTQRVRDVLRDQAKKLISQALGLLPQDEQQAADWLHQVRATQPQLRALAALTRQTQANYQARKAARALWDFSDLEHLALKALGDPAVREELAAAYDAIFVDEYQDISQIQEAIIQRLRGADNSLFMVGDVKQSIYRFRLADPSLFLGKHRAFSPHPDAPQRLITLRENFRSSDNILQAVNLVFEGAMRREATEIDYDEEARLVSGLPGQPGAAVELWLLHRDGAPPEEGLPEDPVKEAFAGDMEDPEEPEEAEGAAIGQARGEMERAFVYEARLIARRIAQLVDSQVTLGGQRRQLQFRDIAILLRTASRRAGVMAEILSASGIPTYSDADGAFYTQSDVRDALSLLQVLDNPRQDIPLLAALACPAFGFTPLELARLRLEARDDKQPLHEVFEELAGRDARFGEAARQLGRWRLMASAMPLERFVALLLRESGLYAAAGAKEEGSLRRANLRLLAARAAPLPEPQNLSDFVERALRGLKRQERDQSASLGMQENVVRIMTMHKSKGLQFPVVFLPDLAASFSRKRPAQDLRLDARLGLALMQVDPALRMRQEGFAMRALKIKKDREELSEEARLLYVGMTRARERLILIGAPDNLEGSRARWSRPPSDYTAGSARSMLDWVATPLAPALLAGQEGLYTAPGGSRWELYTCPISSLQAPPPRPMAQLGPQTSPALEQAARDLFKPLGLPDARVQKSSVTALVNQAARQAALEETPQLKRQELPQTREPQPLYQPAAPGTLSAARRGAAAHKALCALDPARFVQLEGQDLSLALARAADTLLQTGLITGEERQGLDLQMLARFYRSGLARRMAASPARQAEWPFTLQVEGQMILQGVLDACFLEEDAWVLVDYKTDWGEPEVLLSRYRDQMRWYMRALRDITGQPVKEAWLYLLRRGEMVQVTEEAPVTVADMTPIAEDPGQPLG